MRKLILTSSGLGNKKIWQQFLKIAKKPAESIKILFITSAARTDEEKKGAESSRKELIDNGILDANIINLRVEEGFDDEVIDSVDAIYVCGGNTFYLLSVMRRFGFSQKVKEMIENGKIYIGVSAGSIIAGPEINTSSGKNDADVTDLTGLNLTSLAVFPHASNKNNEILKKLQKDSLYDIVPLNDGEALVILNLGVEKIK
jgi:peptidase E